MNPVLIFQHLLIKLLGDFTVKLWKDISTSFEINSMECFQRYIEQMKILQFFLSHLWFAVFVHCDVSLIFDLFQDILHIPQLLEFCMQICKGMRYLVRLAEVLVCISKKFWAQSLKDQNLCMFSTLIKFMNFGGSVHNFEMHSIWGGHCAGLWFEGLGVASRLGHWMCP